MAVVSPEEKYRLLVSKLGADATIARIKELVAQGKAASRLRAVDIMYQDVQWEVSEANAALRGFYLGTYRRGPPGFEANETYVLTEHGPELLSMGNVEMLMELDDTEDHGLLAPVEVSPVDRVKNLGTGEQRVNARDAKVTRINLDPKLLRQWSASLSEIEKAAKPVCIVQPIAAVRDVPPADAWVERDGRRTRDATVAPFPVVTKDGDINLKLSLGSDSDTTGVKISSGEQLLGLLEPDDADNPQAWFDWIANHATNGHEEVMAELRAFVGREVVVFGSGGSEIQRRDEKTGKRVTLPLSGSFVTPTQLGFVLSYNNAVRRIQALASGETVLAAKPTPSAAAPSTPVALPPIRDALLALIGDVGAGKDDVKKLLKNYKADELVDAVETLQKENLIRMDKDAKKYVKVR